MKKTDACFFLKKGCDDLDTFGVVWKYDEIKKISCCCCCCFVSNVLFISSSLFMACLRSRDSNENLYSSQHRPQQQQHQQQQTTKRQQQSIKNSSCPLVTDVVVVVPAVVDSQQNRSITQVLFLLNCIYRISVWLKRRRIFHTRKSMCVAGWLYFRLRNDECVFFFFSKMKYNFGTIFLYVTWCCLTDGSSVGHVFPHNREELKKIRAVFLYPPPAFRSATIHEALKPKFHSSYYLICITSASWLEYSHIISC